MRPITKIIPMSLAIRFISLTLLFIKIYLNYKIERAFSQFSLMPKSNQIDRKTTLFLKCFVRKMVVIMAATGVNLRLFLVAVIVAIFAMNLL
ncbi:hypothetical protein SAG0136_08555 [Streptococcus agalactiae LMG 14747]|uniref:Uncharacterized protein n=1 Tax=Streptococcus agalactiae LMG 14747 TaxID=1154860 RepID=V6Z2U5_STRAG|nr:hypothetical protein SAG0136_08555 [Streptococcus agalactiae LMG 14747]